MLSVYRLPNQLEGEEVIEIIRRDIFILVKKVLFFLLIAILPFILGTIFIGSMPSFVDGEFSYPLILVFVSSYYLFIWLFFFFSFLDYYLDVWIVTNQRIISVEQEGFFSRTISEQRIDKIQDVTSESHGVFPTVFNYGFVHIQTAGQTNRFVFEEVPDPDGIRDLVIKLEQKCNPKKIIR